MTISIKLGRSGEVPVVHADDRRGLYGYKAMDQWKPLGQVIYTWIFRRRGYFQPGGTKRP